MNLDLKQAAPVRKWEKDGNYIMIERVVTEDGPFLIVERKSGDLPADFMGKFPLSDEADLISRMSQWAADNGYT